nr:hypothetical protein [Nostoc sp. ChiSLP03a]
MGSLASSTVTFHTLKPSMSFWNLARDVKQQIATNIQRNELFNVSSTIRKRQQACYVRIWTTEHYKGDRYRG